jgi:hypothetical protein
MNGKPAEGRSHNSFRGNEYLRIRGMTKQSQNEPPLKELKDIRTQDLQIAKQERQSFDP